MFNKKSLIALVSLLVVLCIGVGGTLAYLVATSGPVTNTFEVHEITTLVTEEFANGVKSNVAIQNTGTTDAYIRAAVVVTWQDAQGNVYGIPPVEGTDYELELNENSWVENNGFYYCTSTVASGASTPVLITLCTVNGNAPEGYSLCVEILGSGIQAKGITDNVLAAWGVDPTVD